MRVRVPSVLIATASIAIAAPCRADEAVPPGVVVAKVERGFTADLGGVRGGDVLVSWSQRDGAGQRQGEIASPFVLADLEYGQLPRGPVVLHGTRAGAPLRVEVAADAVGLGVTLRPRFPPALLDLYVRGRKQIDAGQVKEGTSLWREAAVRVRAIEGETAASCWLLGQTGTAWAVAQQADPARAAYDEAVACAEDGDRRVVATILEWQAEQELELGAPEVTVAALEIACALRDAHPDSPPMSGIQCLFDLTSNLSALGRRPEAREIERSMLGLAEREAPDSLLVARLLLRIGTRDQVAGDFEAAETAFRRASDIAERVGSWSSTWARTQIAIGDLAGVRGDLATNEDLYRKAMEHQMRYSPDSLGAARALMNYGTIAAARGDLATAVGTTRDALRVLDRLPTGRSIRGAALNNLGRYALDRADADEALRAFERAAVDIYATAAGTWSVAIIELNLSEALSARGDLDEARVHAETALAAADRTAPRSLYMVSALLARGKLARREGDWDLAEECFAWALETIDDLGSDNLIATEALQGLASVLRHRGDAEGAERHLRRATALFESKRGTVGRSDEERSLFLSSFYGVYRDLIDLLAQQGRASEAFAVLESSRARTLLAMLGARDLMFALDVPPEKERERRAVDAEYERARQRLDRLSAGAPEAEAARSKLAELRERQLQLEVQIRQASPRLAELREPQPLDAAGVAAHLDPGTLLIAYSVGSERTVAFTLESGREDGLRGYLIPAGEDDLRRRVMGWRKLAETGPPGRQFQAESRHLYTLLLGPLEESLRRAQRVIMSADGPLHALPFAALRDERGFLAERKALVFVPSGTVYARQAMARGPHTWGPPAVFGDPRYAAGSYERLPGSRREVAAVATVFRDTRTYVGGQATEEEVKALGPSGRFAHFAVHGIMDERVPLDSALALSTPPAPADGRENGLLHAWEIFERVRLDADLVTLSACRSASGTDRPGEGIIGLTRAFTYAGARSVLASLWNVGDASTGPFMQSFYKAWARGQSKAEALRTAQVDAIRRGQRPLRWAGFQLYGDDR